LTWRRAYLWEELIFLFVCPDKENGKWKQLNIFNEDQSDVKTELCHRVSVLYWLITIWTHITNGTNYS